MWPYRQRILPKGEISTLILAVAEQLICRFVGANSETPVNLSAAIEGEIFGAVEKGEFSKELFLAAETSVRDTLRFGAYARFLRSDLYRQIQGIFDHFFLHFQKNADFTKLCRSISNDFFSLPVWQNEFSRSTRRHFSGQGLKTEISMSYIDKITNLNSVSADSKKTERRPSDRHAPKEENQKVRPKSSKINKKC